jgi:hypothetical protein
MNANKLYAQLELRVTSTEGKAVFAEVLNRRSAYGTALDDFLKLARGGDLATAKKPADRNPPRTSVGLHARHGEIW